MVTIKELINSPLLLALVVGGLGYIMLGMVGFVILVMLPIAIITSRIRWKKGKIFVVNKEA